MQRLDGPMIIGGAVSFTGPVGLPASTVTPAQLNADTADPIPSEMSEQQICKTYATSGTAASATVPIHVAEGDGALVALRCGSIAIAIGAATVTVDLKKNGTTVLSSVVTLDSANTARILEDATISSAAYSEDDFFELVIVATAGGGTIPTGLIVQLVAREAAE